MLYQPAAGLHQPLLQARQGPLLDPLRHRQPPPPVAQVLWRPGLLHTRKRTGFHQALEAV
jgi:hypothetical protein